MKGLDGHMKKDFVNPEIAVVRFEIEDVVSVSGACDYDCYGDIYGYAKF